MINNTHTNNSSYSTYIDTLLKKVIIFDGAMGTNLQNMELTAGDFGGEQYMGCNDYLSITNPQAVESVHRSFLDVGVDVIETNTFRSNRLTLAEYGLQDRVIEINRTAAKIARSLADEYSLARHPRFVAGSIGPSGKLPSMNDPELSNITFDQLADLFSEQAMGLIDGGVDLLLLETSQDILEVKSAIIGIQKAFTVIGKKLPIQAQVTLDTTGRMLLGTDISAVLSILEGMDIQAIGINCSTGPEFMRQSVQYLKEHTSLPVSCIPNAGLPLNVDGKAIYPMEPQPFANYMLEFVQKYGLNIVGGCCGTTPEHMSLLVQKLHDHSPLSMSFSKIPMLASPVQAIPMHQQPAPFLIGERLNSQGSRKFKELLLAEDFESILSIARQQVESGADGLDLCVALTERTDEMDLMVRLIKTLSPAIPMPLIFDTTELDVLEMALKTAPGRSLINSTHFESGREKADKILALAKKFNAAVIILTIDEVGMAKTASRKLEIARRIFDVAVNEHHLRPSDLVFDALTFTLATGDKEFSNSALETFEGIRLIKSSFPDVLTSLGVSNVSFGLQPVARSILNSVMLYHAVQAGLDMAIINPAQLTPYADIPVNERALAENLIFNRSPDALASLIDYYKNVVSKPSEKPITKKEMLKAMTPEQRLHYRILHRISENVEQDIDEILNQHPSLQHPATAVRILNTVLLPAMKEVGDKFVTGELILPFVLQSAEVMKKSVSHLENYLEKQAGVSKGKVILATVYGDVHDIGKNLVKTILSNNGYQVLDLGKQVPAETIIQQAVEFGADAVGLSALLVSTSKQMPIIVNEMHRRALHYPILIGGAAINPHFGRRILCTDQDQFYEAGVFYCKDAFEGLMIMDALTNPEKKPVLMEKNRHDAETELGYLPKIPKSTFVESQEIIRSAVPQAEFIPNPQNWGSHIVNQIPLDAVFQCLPKKDLFRLSWGGKNTHGEAWKKLEKEFEACLDSMRRQAIKDEWIKPQGIYGYFPAQSDGNSLLIYDPKSIQNRDFREIMRFDFPRQPDGDQLCLADYFASVYSQIVDTAIFQIVTIGQEASEHINNLQDEGNYSEAYFTHGLSVQMAEATAEFIHRHIREELGLSPNQGKRYSWGYPSIPDLEDHIKVFSLLPVEQELGMELTTAYQMVPEQSTAAIVIHHPSARYFTVGETRMDYLRRKALNIKDE